jgi:thioredoxin-dependent peroxiredoxin
MSGGQMEKMIVGQAATDFSLLSERGEEWRLSDHIGNVVVLLFYPQNETLVCTRQLCSVRDNWDKYLNTKAVIVGVSPAEPNEHWAFASGKKFPFSLLADPGRTVTKKFAKHSILPINLTRGIVVIDAKGVIRDRNIMLRAFRPKDDELISTIYAARGDALEAEYSRLRDRLKAFVR